LTTADMLLLISIVSTFGDFIFKILKLKIVVSYVTPIIVV